MYKMDLPKIPSRAVAYECARKNQVREMERAFVVILKQKVI